MKPGTVFKPAATAKALIQRFVEDFFKGQHDVMVNIPEIRGLVWSEDPEQRFVNISEIYAGHLNQEGDGLNVPTFPMVLLTYPEFSQIDTGIGSVINKQESYFTSNNSLKPFPYRDPFLEANLELSYKTEEERLWQVLRYHYGFSFSIDIISTETESRQVLADLIRVMMDQYLADLSPFHNLSVPFTLQAFQYETKFDSKPSMIRGGEKRYYPAFFPYGDILITFDTPLLQGTGEYDGVEIFGEEAKYVSTFSVEGIRLEAAHLVERLGFVNSSRLKDHVVVDERGVPFRDKIPPHELKRLISSGELNRDQYEKLRQAGKIPFGFCGGQDPFRLLGK